MLECEEEMAVDGLRLAYGGLHYSGIPLMKTFEQNICWLQEMYEKSDDKKYLENALLHIKAYVRMGLCYRQYEEMFDQILNDLQVSRWSLGKPVEKQHMIRLTYSQVRSMIGKWKPSKDNTMKIGDVVDDIINKVSIQQKGIYFYRYIRGNDKEYLYELVVDEHESYFYDINNKRFYLFDI